jgi:hypothetical protein
VKILKDQINSEVNPSEGKVFLMYDWCTALDFGLLYLPIDFSFPLQ